MIPGKLFIGTLSDGDIKDVLPNLIAEAKNTNDTVYLNWNGVFLCINENRTYCDIIEQYNCAIKDKSIINRYINGELISVNALSEKIANFIVKKL